MTEMKQGFYYEAELLAMGHDMNGDLVLDPDTWILYEGQTIWNILVSLRSDKNEYVSQVLDLDFPVEMRQLAEVIFDIVNRTIEICKRQNVEIF